MTIVGSAQIQRIIISFARLGHMPRRFSAQVIDVWMYGIAGGPDLSYLTPSEIMIFSVRNHPAKLAWAMASVPVTLAISIVLSTGIVGVNSLELGMAWGLFVATLVLSAYALTRWLDTLLTVTDKRVIFATGILARKIIMLTFSEVASVTLIRPALGRIGGITEYGTLVVYQSDEKVRNLRLRYLPYPEQLYLLIMGIFFPEALDDYSPSDWG